jgi:hypothetical protein
VGSPLAFLRLFTICYNYPYKKYLRIIKSL